jgi:4a-hydroxytetrahydrobiopterin dehydratase
MDGRSILFPADTADDLAGTAFIHVDDQLVGTYSTADFASSVRLLDAVAAVADELNHHPEVRLGWAHIEFEVWSHDVGGVTSRDLALARRIGELAIEQGARPGN